MSRLIRITDLGRPELGERQRQALADAQRTPVELTVGAVLSEAVRRSGLDDFGPVDFDERLQLWLEEVDQDPDRTALGRVGLYEQCVHYAVSRLRIQRVLQLHPDLEDEVISKPIIVVGLPRSGTTHLVNLLATDGRLRSLPMWESYEPVPDPAEPEHRQARIARSTKAWETMVANLPHMAAMHPMTAEHVHEELELQCPDFSSYSQEWKTRCPRWRDYYLAHDQLPHYQYLRSVLKILQRYQPAERWVLKCPQHLEQLGPLLATFPDATIVFTHRDPVSVVQSSATMLSYVSRMNYRHTMPEWYLTYWTDRIGQLLEASIRDRPLVPADRSTDVVFSDFMADPMATVEEIYRVADLPLTEEARAGLADYLEAHPRGRDGQVVYDLRADFDATPEEVRDRFGFYFDRFEVPVEVT